MVIEFFFDFSCPYAYLGSTQIESVAASCGATLEWKPMLLGGVFRAVGTAQNMGAGMPPAKARHNLIDMHRWAALWQVPFTMPTRHPMRTVAALRALLSIDDTATWPAAIAAIYESYWVLGHDIAETAVISDALRRAGLPEAAIARAIEANGDEAIKLELRRRTDEAIARGVFGAPATFVGDELYWGQDRLATLAAAHGGSLPSSPALEPSAEQTTIDFYYDFSSPFAYLASSQIEETAKRAGARLRWRPFLLGALFREIGTANVPLLAFGDAKQRYYRRDLTRSAAGLGVPLTWNPNFPIRTVDALRLALLAGDDAIAAFSHAVFRQLWVEGAALSREGLASALCEAGLPTTLLAQVADPETKQRLFSATAEALERGVFGAPTMIVSGDRASEDIYWGADRLELVANAARGWKPQLPSELHST